MKTRTAVPLMFALSFFIVSAGSAHAQMNLHPDYMEVTLDSSQITYNLNQTGPIPQSTVRGSITSLMYAGPITVKLKTAMQWIIQTKISGSTVQDGDMININVNQPLPVEITIAPYAERPDTENYCLYVSDGTTNNTGAYCITLNTISVKSAVSPDLLAWNITLWPNPAASYISLRGLDNMQAGYSYEIYSITGAEVRHGSLPADARINVEALSSGAYRLLLSDGKRTFTNTPFTVLH